MSITDQLSQSVLHTRPSDVPPNVVHSAKVLMLDTIGCAIAALGTAPGEAVRRIVAHQSGGGGDAVVWGTGQTTSVANAAWANGRLANVIDMDECYKVQGHHAQASLGAAFALAEQRGSSGADMLTAFTLGFEVGVRLGNFLSPRVALDESGRVKGWTGLVGPGQGVHAACTAAAYLMGSGPDTLNHAWGLCAQYMVNRDWSRQWGRSADLGTIKYADTGWNAQGGLMAAWQAHDGVTGIRDIFDQDSYGQVFQGVILNPAALVEQLGERWFLPDTSIKFWPCCRWIHYALTALDEVLRRHAIRADEIEAIDLQSFPMIPYPRFGSVRDPSNLVDATFSFPHSAAMVALGVPAGPAWFTDEQMSGEQARAMRHKVGLSVDARGYEPSTWGLEQGELRVPSRAVVTARGTTFTSEASHALGDPWADAPRWTDDDVIAKFHRLAAFGHPASSQRSAHLDRIVAAVMDIDATADVHALAALLAHPD